MLGFKTFYNARRVIIGIERAQKIHKRQFAIPITLQSNPAVTWRCHQRCKADPPSAGLDLTPLRYDLYSIRTGVQHAGTGGICGYSGIASSGSEY